MPPRPDKPLRPCVVGQNPLPAGRFGSGAGERIWPATPLLQQDSAARGIGPDGVSSPLRG